MEKYKERNVQITKVTVEFIGHIHEFRITLVMNNGDDWICINPRRKWFDEKGGQPFYDLFECFDIDAEDGADIRQLEGKYCRVAEDSTGQIIAIEHLVKGKFVLVENLQ